MQPNPTYFDSSLIDQLPIGLFVKETRTFKYVLWNKIAEQLWDLHRSKVLGRSDLEIFDEGVGHYFRSNDLDLLRDGQVLQYDWQMMGPAQQGQRWLRVKKLLIQQEAGEPSFILGVVEDITDLIRSNQSQAEAVKELAQQHEKLVQAARLKALGEMTSGIAHEINTPLGVITMQSEVALDELNQKSATEVSLRGQLEKIRETAFQISDLVKSIRSMSQSGSSEPPQWFNLQDLLRRLADLSAYRLKLEGANFSYESVPSDLFLYGRQVQLSQVFLNLLNNSLDALEKSRAKRVRVEVKDFDCDYFEIRFIDNGPGLDPDIRERVFEAFFTTKSEKGTGIGLSISTTILKDHGADIWVDPNSTDTTFVIHWLKRQSRQDAHFIPK